MIGKVRTVQNKYDRTVQKRSRIGGEKLFEEPGNKLESRRRGAGKEQERIRKGI